MTNLMWMTLFSQSFYTCAASALRCLSSDAGVFTCFAVWNQQSSTELSLPVKPWLWRYSRNGQRRNLSCRDTYYERLPLYATDLIIFIVRGEAFISDMYNLVSDLLYTQESREQGLISLGFLIRIEMQLCYQAA